MVNFSQKPWWVRDVSLVIALVILVASCGRPSAREDLRVRVSGASTVYPIVVMAGEELSRRGTAEVQAQAGGSTRGFEDTLAGRNDFGAMARELTPEEAAQVSRFAIAKDGVGVLVHASNDVPGLTTEDLRRIYKKDMRSWRQLGSSLEEPIVVVTKAAGHATLETFLEHTGLDPAELEVDVVGGDNAQVIRVVANTPAAIAFVSLGEVLHSIEAGMELRLVALDGVEPTLEAVAGGRWPMVRTLYLVSRKEPVGAGRALLEFLASADGRRIIERGNYAPLAP